MKKSILLFLIVVLGLSTEVYGQETKSRQVQLISHLCLQVLVF